MASSAAAACSASVGSGRGIRSCRVFIPSSIRFIAGRVTGVGRGASTTGVSPRLVAMARFAINTSPRWQKKRL